jgi:CheY-like chemotaxis protein
MKKINTVCIIDDDDIYQFTVRILLERTNMVNQVMVFPDGLKAIDFLKGEIDNEQSIPDILFLDINMPVMNGWEFLEEFLLIKPKLPKSVIIYMVSSSLDERDILKAKGIAALSGYLIKPITSENLMESLSSVLN